MFVEAETVSVELADVTVADSATLFGFAEAVRPEGVASVKLTVPEKPFRPLIVIGDVAEDPARTEMEVFTDTVKSTTLTEMMTEWESEPLIPVTLTM
jgi:hypothetical protein